LKEELVRISIEDFNSNKNSLMTRYFSETEKEKQKDLSVQSIAARYALKQAIKNIYPHIDFPLNQIIIGKSGNGAPLIEEFPEVLMEKYPDHVDKIRVSISHSRVYATALAVLFGDFYE
jgi:phosphopantetheine--protein transferase-like protein